MTTTMMKEINRANASRNYLEHVADKSRMFRAAQLEAALCGDSLPATPDEIQDAKRLCETIGGEEGEVLYRHYIVNEPYTIIAKEMAYSERQIKRFAARGCVTMFDMLSQSWKNTVLV